MSTISSAAQGSAWWARLAAYGLFASVFLFEVLNWLGVLDFRVDYTWRGRVLSTAFVFLIVRGLDVLFQRVAGQRLAGGVWLASIVLILVDFLGDIFFFYDRWEWYDRFAHGLSGPLIAGSFLWVLFTLARRLEWRVPTTALYLLAFGINEIFAALYEIEEYLEDVVFGSKRSGIGTDTADDIFLNLVCGLMTVFVVIIWRIYKQKKVVAGTVSQDDSALEQDQ